MNISQFHHICNSCGHGFDAPVLSDFQYGAFIMFSDSGIYNAYLNTFDDKVWDEVGEIIQRHRPLLRNKLQDIFSLTCDLAADGTKFRIENRKCPRCGSVLLNCEIDTKGTSLNVPAITHHTWARFTQKEKVSRILSAI